MKQIEINSTNNFGNGDTSKETHGKGILYKFILFVEKYLISTCHRSISYYGREGGNGYRKIVHVPYIRKSRRWLHRGYFSVFYTFFKCWKFCI